MWSSQAQIFTMVSDFWTSLYVLVCLCTLTIQSCPSMLYWSWYVSVRVIFADAGYGLLHDNTWPPLLDRFSVKSTGDRTFPVNTHNQLQRAFPHKKYLSIHIFKRALTMLGYIERFCSYVTGHFEVDSVIGFTVKPFSVVATAVRNLPIR